MSRAGGSGRRPAPGPSGSSAPGEGSGGAGRRGGGTDRRGPRRPATGRRQPTGGRRPRADPARRAALDVLRQVADSDAYANLVLPPLLRERGISGRDAGFATELTYGTLRLRGRYDAILARCSGDRPLNALDPAVLDVLRLGTHQILGMRVPAHAAVSESVTLTREAVGPAPAGLVNAVLRAVAARPVEEWLAELGTAADPAGADDVARLAVTESHPEWITRALRQALVAGGRPATELPALLAADNAAPRVTLVARPGLVSVAELAEEAAGRRPGGATTGGPPGAPDTTGGPPGAPGTTGGPPGAPGTTPGTGAAPPPGTGPHPGRWSPFALAAEAGDPGRLPSVRRAAAGVQDEGSQLVTLALAAAPLGPGGADRHWLDLCAGPGGKAALLGALARERGADLLANELAPHRAGLVRASVGALPPGVVRVRVGDGRELGAAQPGTFDRVLVDAPCTGLGALRRRPESRWRRSVTDLTALTPLQHQLLTSALDAVRPGGVVAYVTCSPHVAETRLVVQDVLRRREDVEVLDAVAVLQQVARSPVPDLTGPYVQLWPHHHGTDAMFLALLRRRPDAAAREEDRTTLPG